MFQPPSAVLAQGVDPGPVTSEGFSIKQRKNVPVELGCDDKAVLNLLLPNPVAHSEKPIPMEAVEIETPLPSHNDTPVQPENPYAQE